MRYLTAAAMLLLVRTVPLPASVFTFDLIPGGGSISASPGDTAGWGYSIANLDPTLFLETTNVDAGVFTHGSANAIFDFPFVNPGDSASETWSLGVSGLYEFTWDPAAAPGSVNTGSFVVTGQFWDGVPYAPGSTRSGSPVTESASYSISTSIVGPGVPEPAAVLECAAVLLLAAMLRLRQRRLAY